MLSVVIRGIFQLVKKNLSAPSNVLQHHRRHAARPQRHPQLLSAQWPRRGLSNNQPVRYKYSAH
jgi:hypothetical protein